LTSMRVAFYTLGCKLNQAETESLVGQFSRSGFQVVPPDDVADVYVANTCTVTHIADRKSRHWLRLARRRNPQAIVIATGCYAQRGREELADLADLVVGNAEKGSLPDLIRRLAPEDRAVDHTDAEQSQAPAAAIRTRSLIKIQDGCHGPCTYCIVPRVRSHMYSLPASRIIDEVKQKVALGYREVVLTGTKVGSYGEDHADLADLVRQILCDTGIERLRLSSLQPSEISSALLSLWRDERLCQHFHLALQSGSESVLQRMRRSYSLNQYQRTLGLIREKIPDAAVTTDIIVGFPGENDEEFEQSYCFCRQAGFANIHVFPFSPRPETAAEIMPGQVNDGAKRDRSRRMIELSRTCQRLFGEQFLGRVLPVLFEKESSPGNSMYTGLTSNYLRVLAPGGESLGNEIRPVKLTAFHDMEIMGEVVRENPC
jgi:threonylcarbamoyladenosine tRNA methylthiotransferase MtaB